MIDRGRRDITASRRPANLYSFKRMAWTCGSSNDALMPPQHRPRSPKSDVAGWPRTMKVRNWTGWPRKRPH